MAHLLRNLVLFGRVLRGLGLDVNPGRMMDLVQALSHVEVGLRSDFYHASRSLLVHQRDDIPLFDQAFEMFWQKPLGDWKLSEIHGRRVRRTTKPKPLVVPPPLESESSGIALPDDAQERPVIEVTKTYSAREALRRRDFPISPKTRSKKSGSSSRIWFGVSASVLRDASASARGGASIFGGRCGRASTAAAKF